MTDPRSPLAFAHIGDLHITDAEQPNYLNFLSILVQLEIEGRGKLDFVVVPGDCAENGLGRQYALIAKALRILSIPVHIIPGDHDMEQGGLESFYSGLGVPRLPNSFRIKGYRCLFLDFCSAGSGGPDFRLGREQFSWLEVQLREAREALEAPLLFMHAYPADLADRVEAAELTRLIADHQVALVDMGHTHYNELANDGTTIFAATRSTGQIEEGPVGYSLVTLDAGRVGWRFKPLADPFPFVAITAPADYRLARADRNGPAGDQHIRARIFGAEEIRSVEYRIDDGPWRPMCRIDGTPDWSGEALAAAGRFYEVCVRALSHSGRPGLHMIRAAGPDYAPIHREPTGSDAAALEAWPENGISGARLGPNRNGRKW